MTVTHLHAEPPREFDHLDGDGASAWWAMPLIGLAAFGVWFAALMGIIKMVLG